MIHKSFKVHALVVVFYNHDNNVKIMFLKLVHLAFKELNVKIHLTFSAMFETRTCYLKIMLFADFQYYKIT